MREDLLVYGKAITSRSGYIAGQVEVTSRCVQACAHCQNRADAKKHGYKDILWSWPASF
jgi:MoaA/NifB/PqqE/SkfB family radical SAM enzyme